VQEADPGDAAINNRIASNPSELLKLRRVKSLYELIDVGEVATI